jgi:hypothetical protein
MKKNLLFFILMLGIIFSACKTQNPPLTDAQKAEIEKQILELSNTIANTAEKLDINGYSAFLSSDEFIASYLGGSAFQSKAEWVDSVGVWWSKRKSQEIGQRKFKVTVLSEDLVLLDRVSIWQIYLKDDRIRRNIDALSVIFKKEATGWKIIHIHESGKDI